MFTVTGQGHDFESAFRNALEKAIDRSTNKFYEHHITWRVTEFHGMSSAILDEERGKQDTESEYILDLEVCDILHNE